MTFRAIVAAAALLTGATDAFGEDAPPSSPVTPLVVTATRVPTPEDLVGSSVTLITAEAIADHQWRMAPEALASVPGLNLVQVGGPGGLTSVFIRGANANQTKVLIDGIEVNDPSQNDIFDFGQLQTAAIQRMEVLRGPQGSLYGADALGGVISVTTRRGEGPPRLTASVEAGAFAAFNQFAGIAGSRAAFHYAIDIAHVHVGATPVTPLDLLQPGQARNDDSYDNLTEAVRLGLDAGRAVSLSLAVRAAQASLATTGDDFAFYPALADAEQTRQQSNQFFARLEAQVAGFAGKWRTTVGAGYASYRTLIQAPDDGFGPPPPVLDRSERMNLDWQTTASLSPTTTLVIGVADSDQWLLGGATQPSQNDLGAFVEAQSHPSGPVAFSASARYDHAGTYGGHASWRVAPVVTLQETRTLFRGTVGTGFKAPTLAQLYVSYPEFGFFANPRLRPETSVGYDIGIEQPLIGSALRLGATWFHAAITDLIEATPTTWANVGHATTYGVESFAALALGRSLSVRGDYTWTVAEDAATGEALLRRPASKASLLVTWTPTRRWTLSATGLYVGPRFDGNRDFSIPRLINPAYATIDLAAAYGVGRGLTLYAKATNLLDRRYQEPFGFEKPGLGVLAGIRADLGVNGD